MSTAIPGETVESQESTLSAGPSPRRQAGAVGLAILDRALDTALVVLVFVSTAVTLLQVFLRYFLNSPVTWSEELARFAFLWLVFIGGAVAVRTGSHIYMDTFIQALPRPLRQGIGVFAHLTECFVFLFLIAYGWVLLVAVESLSVALQWPVRLFYASVPVGAALMLLNFVRVRRGEGWRAAEIGGVIAAAGALVYLFGSRSILQPLGVDIGVLVLVSAVGLMLLGVPIVLSLAAAAILGYWSGTGGGVPFTALPHQMANGVDTFLLLAIPFFLLAGQLMNAGGITPRLIGVAAAFVGHMTGGLAQVDIVANWFMGGMSGSASADAAGIGKIMIPEMERRGYRRAFSCAVTSSASILSNLIPPSITMMIYASIITVSVGRLFIAGVLPGTLLAVLMMVAAYFISKRRGYGGTGRRATRAEMLTAIKDGAWALGMPVVILGGMRFGMTTPTEAAAIAVLYSFLVGTFVYGELKLRDLPSYLLQTSLETAVIMLILGGSQPFSWILTAEQVPQEAARAIVGVSENPLVFLMLLNIFLLLVGLPLEPNPALVILMPIMAPLLPLFHLDPVHFGVLVITNLLLGGLTPPVGMIVFVTSSIGKIPPMEVFKECLPFILVCILGLLLITYWPQFTLFLPNLLMGEAL